MTMFIQSSLDTVQHLQALLAGPTPLGIEAPPEIKAEVLKILKWIAWLASAACVGGLIITAARMALNHRRGDDTNVAQLGWVLAACILIGSASSIVAVLLHTPNSGIGSAP